MHRTEHQSERDRRAGTSTARLIAAAADTLFTGAATAGFALAASLLIVLAAMTAGGGELPAAPGDMLPYVCFAMVEMLAMTPLSFVTLSVGAGVWVLLWACRGQMLWFRSPGMVLAGMPRGGRS